MRIGYYWPEIDKSNLMKNSDSAMDFFLELFDKNLIIVKNGDDQIDISELQKEDYFKISNTTFDFLNQNGKTTILQYIKYRLKNDNQSVHWLQKYLTEDTEILGFKLTETPYRAIHQNLFQENVKIEDENFTFINSFLLKKTNNKNHRLFLCSKRTFNSHHVRLVLKSHKNDQILGIIMINGLSNITLKANDIIYIDKKHFEIGHISQIHYNNEIKNFYLHDRDFNNTEIISKLTYHKEKIIELCNNLHMDMIPVEFHNFVRCEIQSTIAKFKAAVIPCVIGQKSANFNYIHYDGRKIETYFSFFKNYSILEKSCNGSSNNYYNYYLGTHISKSNNVYIQVKSPDIDYLLYNFEYDFFKDSWAWGNLDILDDTFINYAERGYSKIEIDKKKQEFQYWKELLDDRPTIDYGINWNLYNDQLDIDQQDPEFW